MKLLLDQNISRKLVDKLKDAYPESSHVSLLGLQEASDKRMWNYAKRHGFVIVSQDSDFNDLATLYGSPPKVIWLRIGNSSTKNIEQILRDNLNVISMFVEKDVLKVLHLY